MDEVLIVAVPVALIAAATALVKPARKRVVPVAKAVGRAGVGVVGVTAVGALGIVDAAVHGEATQSGPRVGRGDGQPATTASGAAQRRPAKASSSRTRGRSPASSTS